MNQQRPPNQGIPGQQGGHPVQGPRPTGPHQVASMQNMQGQGLTGPVRFSVTSHPAGFPQQGTHSQHMPVATTTPYNQPMPNQIRMQYPPGSAIRQPIMAQQQVRGFLSQQQTFQGGHPNRHPVQGQYPNPNFNQQFRPMNPRAINQQNYINFPQQQFNHPQFAQQYPSHANQMMTGPRQPFPQQPRPQPPHQGVQQNQMSSGPPGGPVQTGPQVSQGMMNPEVKEYVPNPNQTQFQPGGYANFQPPHVAQPQQQAKEPRRSRAILIKDPETGKAIDMDDANPRSRQSSQSQKHETEKKEEKTEPESKPEVKKSKPEVKKNEAPKQEEPKEQIFLPNEMVTKSKVKNKKSNNIKKKHGGGSQTVPNGSAPVARAALSEHNGNTQEINGNSIQEIKPDPVPAKVEVAVETVIEDKKIDEADDGGWEEQKPRKQNKNRKNSVQQEKHEPKPKSQKGKDNKKNGQKSVEPPVTVEAKVESPKKTKEPEVEQKSAEVDEPPKSPEPIVQSTPEDVVTEEKTEATKIEHVVATPPKIQENVPVPSNHEQTEEVGQGEPVQPEAAKEAEEPLTNGVSSIETENAEVTNEEATEEQVNEEKTDDNPLPEFHSLALENRAKIEAGEKVTYGRDFLIKFQSACLQKPEALPELDVILSGPTEAHRKAPVHERPQHSNFMPGFAKGKGKNYSQTRRPSAHDRQKKNPIVIKLPGNTAGKKLHTTDNAYKKGVAADLDDSEKKKQEFQRKAKIILNKLTPDNESRLTEEFLKLQPDSFELLNVIVATLFDKAIQEPHFSTLYARLCKKCHERWQNQYKFPFDVVQQGKKVTKEKAFREVLLQKAQDRFERLKILHIREKDRFDKKSLEWKRIDFEEKLAALPKEGDEGYDKEKRNVMEIQEELSDLNHRIKNQSMGNVTFVGELYLQKLLSVNIMIGCMRQLISSDHETELESLSKLIPTIGAELEKEQRGQENLAKVFQQIEQVIQNGKTLGPEKQVVSPRVCCLLQDIIDLKQRRWVERGVKANMGPKSRDQLHKDHEDAEKRKLDAASATLSANASRRTQENRRNRELLNRGEWVSQTQSVKAKFDPTKLAGPSKPRGDESSLSLGPGRKRVTKNSSIDSSKGNSGRSTPVNSRGHINKWDLLGNDDDGSTPEPENSMTRSISYHKDSRRNSNIEGPPSGHRGQRSVMNKHMTHDGRTAERRKLSPEEVTKKTRTIYNDFLEAQGSEKLLFDVCDDILKFGLLEANDHQVIMIKQLINEVLERKDQERLAMGKFFNIMADRLTGLNFEKPLVSFIETCIDEDFITDCPKFWDFFSMIIAPIFKSTNVDPKIATTIFAKAGDEECQQLTKAYVKLLEELSYIMKNPELHDFYKRSKIDIGAAMEKDGFPGSAKERLNESRRDLSFLLEPLVIIDWVEVEKGLVDILKSHDFTTDSTAEDFTKEFDFLEQKVPEKERRHINFTKVVVRAIMKYSTQREGENWKLVRSQGGAPEDLALTDCDILLKKYLDGKHSQMDALFIIAEEFEKFDNNKAVINESFLALFETSVLEAQVFFQWKDHAQTRNLPNYAIIESATVGFYNEIKGQLEGAGTRNA